MRAHMREQNYLDRAKLNPARAFKTPMDVVETDDIDPAAKLAILKAWEADERALLRAEDEGMGGGEHAHLQKVQAALAQLSRSFARPAQPSRRPRSLEDWSTLGAGRATKVIVGSQHVESHRIRLSAQHFRQRCAARSHA